MNRALPRALSALLLACALALTGCSGQQSGDSNPDNQQDQAPAEPSGEATP
jgi:hypothetical protein